jgi:hypothetical protein
MLNALLNSFFGCSHKRTTFPITPNRSVSSVNSGSVNSGSVNSAMPENRTGTYVACLDCGQELAYDWKSMRVGEAWKAPAPPPREAVEVQPHFRVGNTLLTSWIRR